MSVFFNWSIATMKKAFVFCLIALCSVGVMAEWLKLGSTGGGSLSYYFDPTTIRIDGNLGKVWALQDLRQRGSDGEMSIRTRYEFDCKGDRVRILALSLHAGPMAGGMIIRSFGNDPTGWEDVPPNTPSESKLKIVCSK